MFAIDGGRMQLFNWIPPDDVNKKGRKEAIILQLLSTGYT